MVGWLVKMTEKKQENNKAYMLGSALIVVLGILLMLLFIAAMSLGGSGLGWLLNYFT